ncbi:hypothetical protein D3C76_1638770 [compost metagenome]
MLVTVVMIRGCRSSRYNTAFCFALTNPLFMSSCRGLSRSWLPKSRNSCLSTAMQWVCTSMAAEDWPLSAMRVWP